MLQNTYIKFRNLLNVTVKKAKDTFYFKRISDAKGNTKKIWELINEATDKKHYKVHIVPTILNQHNLILTDGI